MDTAMLMPFWMFFVKDELELGAAETDFTGWDGMVQAKKYSVNQRVGVAFDCG
jgi:hypothetical protein